MNTVSRRGLACWVLMVLVVAGCAATRDVLVTSPLEGVEPVMQDYHFWTGKLPAPEEVLLPPEEIEARNRLLSKRNDLYLHDPLSMPGALSSEEVRGMLVMGEEALRRPLFTHLNHPMDDATKEALHRDLNLDAIPPSVDVQFAMTLRECSIRVLPTNRVAMEKPDDYEFDQFQYTRITPGEALAVMHHSPGGEWSFVVSTFCRGWIETRHIAAAHGRDSIAGFCSADPFVIYTGVAGHVYHDRECTRFAASVRMGTRLPLVEEREGYVCVRMPIRDTEGYLSFTEAFLPRDASVHIGYLPFTQRNIARLAFGLMGSGYGWGGMFEGRDCSRFILDIFRCVGMLMPRNSASQAQAGYAFLDVSTFPTSRKKEMIVAQGVPFATLLYMRGHIMLYIGEQGKRPYAIHSLWAYRENVLFKDRLRKVSRVVVSDLHLGEGSQKGSLIERFSGMVFLAPR
ncbi:MAG: SH3 domain-containing protein [bacterium]